MRGLLVSCAAALFFVGALGSTPPAMAQTEAAAQPPLPVPIPVRNALPNSENAREILARARPSVAQIRGFFGNNTAHAFHGTGFAAAEGGLFITNYHVVAETVQFPGKYRLEYVNADGQKGAVAVVAIDVRHDLALVRLDGFAPPPLPILAALPEKGSRAYSVGYPLDVGLTITEGISNGKVPDTFEPRIHYSGAINAGMSGGPAFDADGRVVGVNVSGYLFTQLVSFLVPTDHVTALLEAGQQKDTPSDLKLEARRQITEHASLLLAALGGPLATQTISDYILPGQFAPFMNCNATGRPVTQDPVQQTQFECSAKAGIYVQQGFYTGDLKFTHHVLTTEKLGAWRFTNRLSALVAARGAFGSPRNVGPFACEDRMIALKGFDAAVLVCTRAHRKLKGLYDFTVRVSSLNGTRSGFASHLDMYGVEFQGGLAFVERFVAAMEAKS